MSAQGEHRTGRRSFQQPRTLSSPPLHQGPALIGRGPVPEAGHLALSHRDMPEHSTIRDVLHQRGGKVRRMGDKILPDRPVAIAARVMALDAAVIEQYLSGADDARILRQWTCQSIHRGWGSLIAGVIGEVRRRQRRLLRRELRQAHAAHVLRFFLPRQLHLRAIRFRGYGSGVGGQQGIACRDRLLRRCGTGRVQRRVVRLAVHLVAAAGQRKGTDQTAYA